MHGGKADSAFQRCCCGDTSHRPQCVCLTLKEQKGEDDIVKISQINKTTHKPCPAERKKFS